MYTPTMPFGKHRGRPLSEIETSYLEWAYFEADAVKPYLKEAIRQELECRQVGDSTPRHEPGRGVVDARSIIKQWYRQMALKYHPDRTLDNGAAMKAINAGYERLLELFQVSR